MEWTDKPPTKTGWYGHVDLFLASVTYRRISIDYVEVYDDRTIVMVNGNGYDITDEEFASDLWTNKPIKLPKITKELVDKYCKD